MDIDTIKKELSSYQNTQHDIKSNLVEYERIMAIGTKITQTLKNTPGGSGENNSKVELCAIKLKEITDNIECDVVDMQDNRDYVISLIDKAGYRYKDVLTYKYINGLSNIEIGKMMHKDRRQIYNIINAGIDSIYSNMVKTG